MREDSTVDALDEAGISALVRAGEQKKWFFGHFGASIIAGARLLRDPALPSQAAAALSEKLRRMRVQHHDWYARLQGLTDRNPSTPAPLEPLLKVLRESAGTMRTSGHSTIYITHALTVLARRPQMATIRVIDALISLHEAGREDDPARFLGHTNYFDEIDRERERVPEMLGDSISAVRGAVSASDHIVGDQMIEGRYYFLTGEKIHLFTHAHAIATLEEFGYTDISRNAMRAQDSLLGLTDGARELTASTKERPTCTPYDAEFWQQDVLDPAHVIKLAEAVVAEIPRLNHAEQLTANERLGGLWAELGIR